MGAFSILVRMKTAYGRDYFYPMNQKAQMLLKFVSPDGKRKAFTDEQIKIGQEIGLEILIQPPEKYAVRKHL